MKKRTINILVLLSLSSLLGFNTGDEVEIDNYLNARTSPEFNKYSKNIRTTLSAGTTGVVVEIKKLPSGNSGIKMKISSGPKAGESYWVYYDKKNPGLKLQNIQDKKEVALEIVEVNSANEPTSPISAETTRDISGRWDTQEHAMHETVQAALDILKVDALQNIITPEYLCKQQGQVVEETDSSPKSFKNFDVSVVKEPLREVYDFDSLQYSTICKFNKNWNYCHNLGLNKEEVPNGFDITNKGGNTSVKSTNGAFRQFGFNYPGAARSNMHLLIWDMPGDLTYQNSFKQMHFFPREVMHSVRESETDPNIMIVTLPTREEVYFNTKTKEVVGGALTEKPLVQLPNGYAKMPNVEYNGKGVVIEATGKDTPSAYEGGFDKKTVSIKKKGHPTCTAPMKDLWTPVKVEAFNKYRTEFSKSMATDAAVDAYVKKKCGFSIY